jgi:hypothetical protein
MKNSSQEHKAVSKASGGGKGMEALNRLFSPEEDPKEKIITAEEILASLNLSTSQSAEDRDLQRREREMEMREREMGLKERQSGINAGRAITGVVGAWAVVGLTVLARSCINFDKGPKFRV